MVRYPSSRVRDNVTSNKSLYQFFDMVPTPKMDWVTFGSPAYFIVPVPFIVALSVALAFTFAVPVPLIETVASLAFNFNAWRVPVPSISAVSLAVVPDNVADEVPLDTKLKLGPFRSVTVALLVPFNVS